VPVLGAFVLAGSVLGMDPGRTVTVSFLTLAFGQLAHLFNMAEGDSKTFRNEVTRNPWAWGALVLCTALLLAAVYLPGLARVLQVQPPGAQGWLLVVGMSLVPLIGGRLWHVLRK
jgi:Ca2+-transporting ATPase